jgi:ABC-2 type transport system permease protein
MNALSTFRLALWEVRRLARERHALVLLALWTGLLALAASYGVRDVRARHADIAAVLERDQVAWASKRARLAEIESGRAEAKPFQDPRSPTNSVMGRSGERPVALLPTPLAALSAGTGDLAPAVRNVSMITKLHLPVESLENPANRLAGPLDLAFITAALLPLFVLALSFDVLARERDAGILPLLGTQPVALTRLIAARLAVHFVALWLPLAVTATAAVLLTLAPGAAALGALGEVGVWLSVAAAYAMFWQALAALINFRSRSAAHNAVLLCGAWLAAVVVLPSVVQAIVQTVAPPPDRREFVLHMREIETDLFKRIEEIRDAYYAADPSRRPAMEMNEYDTYFVQNLWPRAIAADAALAPALQKIDRARAAQSAWWRRLAWLSPTLAFRLATEQLAGVTPVQQAAFIDHARSFQQRWREHFGAKLAAMTPLTLADYDTKPDPVPASEAFASRLSFAAPALGGVLALTMFVLALWRGSRPSSVLQTR